MHADRSLTVYRSHSIFRGEHACHTCSPGLPPCHECPPTTHAPCHACPPVEHAPYHASPPAMHAPGHACQSPGQKCVDVFCIDGVDIDSIECIRDISPVSTVLTYIVLMVWLKSAQLSKTFCRLNA